MTHHRHTEGQSVDGMSRHIDDEDSIILATDDGILAIPLLRVPRDTEVMHVEADILRVGHPFFHRSSFIQKLISDKISYVLYFGKNTKLI